MSSTKKSKTKSKSKRHTAKKVMFKDTVNNDKLDHKYLKFFGKYY